MGRVSHTAEKRSEDPNKRKPGDTFPSHITSLQVEVSKRLIGHGVIVSVFGQRLWPKKPDKLWRLRTDPPKPEGRGKDGGGEGSFHITKCFYIHFLLGF